MKKFLALTICSVMMMQSMAFANKMGHRDLRENAEQIRVEDLTLDQLNTALNDLRKRNATLKEDLADAEKRDDGRFVVKLRNGVVLASGATVAVGLFLIFGQDVSNLQMRGILVTVAGGLGILASGVVQAAVIVTREDLSDLEESINVIDHKITKLQEKIESRIK